MKKVVVYSKVTCPYCVNAKQLLDSQGILYEEIIVDNDPVLRAEVERLSGRRTVPQIFIDGQSIGGFTDLKALHEAGELARLVK